MGAYTDQEVTPALLLQDNERGTKKLERTFNRNSALGVGSYIRSSRAEEAVSTGEFTMPLPATKVRK